MKPGYERCLALFVESLDLDAAQDRQLMLLAGSAALANADVLGSAFWDPQERAAMTVALRRLLLAARREGDREREGKVLEGLLAVLPPTTDEYRLTALDLANLWSLAGRRDEQAQRLYRLVRKLRSQDVALLVRIEACGPLPTEGAKDHGEGRGSGERT